MKNYNILFGFSIFLGLCLIAFELFNLKNSQKIFFERKAVAIVNDVDITEDQFLKYAINLGADIEEDDDREILELILERMIEEELLVQRGLELNLHTKDIQVRKELIQQVINFIVKIENTEPTDDQLENYFLKNIKRYESNKKIQINTIFIKSLDPESQFLGTEYDYKTLDMAINNYIRNYTSDIIEDQLHLNREHKDIQISIWYSFYMNNVKNKLTIKSRNRDTISPHGWVESIKTFDKIVLEYSLYFKNQN